MRKRYLYAAIAVIALCAVCVFGRSFIGRVLRHYGIIDTYYTKKVSEFTAMPRNTESIVFLGDSITDYVNFAEVLPSYDIINRGIAGDTTSGVLRRLSEVISLKPRKLFILIGTNDIGGGSDPVNIAENIRLIVSRVQSGSPESKIYLQAVFPTRYIGYSNNAKIQDLNARIKAIADDLHCTFIDLYPLLLDSESYLAPEYTLDGLHLTSKAVAKWMAFVAPYLDE